MSKAYFTDIEFLAFKNTQYWDSDQIRITSYCLESIADKVYKSDLNGMPTYYIIPNDEGEFAVVLDQDGIGFIDVSGGIRPVLQAEYEFTDRFGCFDWLEVQAAYYLATNPTPAPDDAKKVRIWVEYDSSFWDNYPPVDCYLTDDKTNVLWFDTKQEAEEFLAGYEVPEEVERLTIV